MQERSLLTSDGLRIDAAHHLGLPGADPRCVMVVVHGFTVHRRKPRLTRVLEHLRQFGSVITLDLRGHGESEGHTTVGHFEVLDAEAAVRWAHELGYEFVATVGFSLGGAVVLREAALLGAQDDDARPDAVVAVSAPAFWYYRGTRVMRRAHRLVETRVGRLVLKAGKSTRVSDGGWPDPAPIAPHVAAGRLGSTPLLIVHGDVDRYFPLEHPQAIHRSATDAGVPAELWIERGYGHAEREVTDGILDRIGAWVRRQCEQQVGVVGE